MARPLQLGLIGAGIVATGPYRKALERLPTIKHVRRVVGDEMALMLDPACQIRTFLDTLAVGKACDEANYLWLEDPARDTGVSQFSHQKLRQLIKTPILCTEHVRGLEPKADFVINGGTAILRADPEYDLTANQTR